MDLVMAQYIEVNAIAIVILCTMLFYMAYSRHRIYRNDEKYFVKMLISNAFVLFFDILIYLARGNTSTISYVLTNIVVIVYFMLQSFFGYYWLRYSIIRLFPDLKLPLRLKFLCQLPNIVNCIFVILSPFTHMVYYLTVENRYVRGDYMVIVTALSYLYWIISGIIIFYELYKKMRVRETSVYLTLIIFPLPTLIGSIAQLKLYGMSIGWVCSAISLLILFINIQNYELSKDSLTGLFNRTQTCLYIKSSIKKIKNSSKYAFVMMIDVDRLKSINDTFGHIVGDRALITISNILKKSFRENDFIARYGGDEFIVIGSVENENELKSMLKKTTELMIAFNETEVEVFNLAISCGYSMYNKDDKVSYEQVIADADKNMYKMKENKI